MGAPRDLKAGIGGTEREDELRRTEEPAPLAPLPEPVTTPHYGPRLMAWLLVALLIAIVVAALYFALRGGSAPSPASSAAPALLWALPAGSARWLPPAPPAARPPAPGLT